MLISRVRPLILMLAKLLLAFAFFGLMMTGAAIIRHALHHDQSRPDSTATPATAP